MTEPGDDQRTNWDLVLKQLIGASLTEILAFAGIAVDAATLVPAPVDLPANARRADLVFLGANGLVVQIEIQLDPDRQMGLRLLDYAVRLLVGTGANPPATDVVQIVIQIRGNAMPTRWATHGIVHTYHLVHIPEMPAAALLATPGLAPLALIGGGDDAVPPVIDRIAETPDPEQRVQLLTLALQLVPRLASTIVNYARRMRMFDVIDELRETEFGREMIALGLEQGLEQGAERARLHSVTELLTRRFPDAPTDRIVATATRVIADNPDHYIGAALDLNVLDPER